MNHLSTTLPIAKDSTPVYARSLWNDIGLVVAGQAYEFSATGRWWDLFVRCGPDGYSARFLQPISYLKRSPDHNLFCLMGAIDRDPATIFRIGSSRRWVAPRTGTLSCFANDISWMRWNNWGYISIELCQ